MTDNSSTTTPVHYPGAVEDPNTGRLISDAEVAETPDPLRLGSGRTITVRLVEHRVEDARYPDALSPVCGYHPFVTNSVLPTTDADLTHRRHAVIETTFADLINGPLGRIPSGCSPPTAPGGPARSSRTTCCAPSPATPPCAATWSTCPPLRRIGAQADAAPPAHWPRQIAWKTLWDNVVGYQYPTAQPRAA